MLSPATTDSQKRATAPGSRARKVRRTQRKSQSNVGLLSDSEPLTDVESGDEQRKGRDEIVPERALPETLWNQRHDVGQTSPEEVCTSSVILNEPVPVLRQSLLQAATNLSTSSSAMAVSGPKHFDPSPAVSASLENPRPEHFNDFYDPLY